MKKEKYCRYCGIQLKPYRRAIFDVFTGKPIIVSRCFNGNCKEACMTLGHQRDKFWKWSTFLKPWNWEECQRCGYFL